MKAINVTELKTHLSRYLRLASRGARVVVKDRDEPIAELGPPHVDPSSWHDRLVRPGRPRPRTQNWDSRKIRALDAIHVATAEILAAEAEGEPLEFWTHDERQATAAMSRGLTVRGLPDSLPSDAGTDVGISG